jgi:hypothetical protein
VAHENQIEAGQGLVQDQKLRLVQEGGHELHLLLIAFGELFEPRVGQRGELQPREPVQRVLADLCWPPPFDLGEEEELFEDLHLFVKASLLRQVTDPVPRRRAGLAAEELDPPAIGQEDSIDHPQGGGFPRSVAAEQPANPSRPHGERGAVDGARRAEDLCDVEELQDFRQRLSHDPGVFRAASGIFSKGRGISAAT